MCDFFYYVRKWVRVNSHHSQSICVDDRLSLIHVYLLWWWVRVTLLGIPRRCRTSCSGSVRIFMRWLLHALYVYRVGKFIAATRRELSAQLFRCHGASCITLFRITARRTMRTIITLWSEVFSPPPPPCRIPCSLRLALSHTCVALWPQTRTNSSHSFALIWETYRAMSPHQITM